MSMSVLCHKVRGWPFNLEILLEQRYLNVIEADSDFTLIAAVDQQITYSINSLPRQ